MPTTEQKELLDTLFSEAAHEAVRQSGLHDLVENNREWDNLGFSLGAVAQKLVFDLIEAKMVEILEGKMSATSPTIEEQIEAIGA